MSHCHWHRGAGEPAFAEAGFAGDRQVIMGLDPVTFDKAGEQAAVEPAGSAVIYIFWCGLMAQLGVAQARTKPLILPIDELSIQEQGEPVGMAQAAGGGVIDHGAERLGHAVQTKGVELIQCGMVEHRYSPQ
jgi:hypothetical protein